MNQETDWFAFNSFGFVACDISWRAARWARYGCSTSLTSKQSRCWMGWEFNHRRQRFTSTLIERKPKKTICLLSIFSCLWTAQNVHNLPFSFKGTEIIDTICRPSALERDSGERYRLRGRTRTYYLRFRKPTLYPDELRGVRTVRYHEKFAKKSLYLSILFDSYKSSYKSIT